MTWKLIRVDEDCWMPIPQGGRITYLQEYVLLSILWQQRSLERFQMNQGNSNEGKAFLFQVIVLVGQQWSLPQGLLMVSCETNWWSELCLIPQSYRKPLKQAHANNSRAVPSKSTFGVLTQKKCDRDLRCSTPRWIISALQQPGTGAHGCKYWHSSSTALRRQCGLMVR